MLHPLLVEVVLQVNQRLVNMEKMIIQITFGMNWVQVVKNKII